MHTSTNLGAGARAFPIHPLDHGLANEAYVVQRFRAMADGGERHGPNRTVASLAEVRAIRPERNKIVVITGLGTENSGSQY